MEKITFENGSKLQKIDSRAFYGPIKSFYVPSSVTEISPDAFNGCLDLKIIAFDEDSKFTNFGKKMFTGLKNTIIMIPSAFRKSFLDSS